MQPTLENITDVLDALHSLGPKTVIITSLMIDDTCFLFASQKDSVKLKIAIPLKKHKFTGTGDLFSALLLAHLSLGIQEACERSVDIIQAILVKTLEVRKDGYELAIVHSAKLIQGTPRSHTSIFI